MQTMFDNSGAKDPRTAASPFASTDVAQMSLAATTAQRVAIPAGATVISFSFDGPIWALFGNSGVTAAIGSAATVGANAEYDPGVRRIPSGATHVSVIAPEARVGSLSFWS